jgi:hypothetical protein
MKKILICAILLNCLACDDGDLQIETLDFDSASIQVCDDNPVEANSTNVLFKLNDTEALILELPADAILNEVTLSEIEKSVSVSGPAKVTYRTFSDGVSKDYFCSEIPLTEPTVVEEIVAEGGSVFISTAISTDSTIYEHTISLSGISLLTSNNSRITDLSINNFGTVTTSAPIQEEEE